MRAILTDALCKTKPPQAGRLEISDLRQSGLVLRVTPSGARSFGFRFRHPDSRSPLRITIGTYPTTSLEAARKRARDMASQVEAGVNPIEAKKIRREEVSTRTFQALSERFIKEHSERHKRPRSVEEDRRNLVLHVLPKWEKRDYRTIRRSDIIQLIEGIVSTGKHTAGNRVHALISSIFSFAIDAELLEANPAVRLRKRGKEQPRRRVLSNEEIRIFWNGIVGPPITRAIGLALRLALLTGARASEIVGARKDEFEALDNPQEAKWTLPAPRVKNAHDHLIPLSPLALETIHEAILLSGDSEFLFPAQRNPNKPVKRQALPAAMQVLGTALDGSWRTDPPTPHDLRRTLNTRLAKMGVAKEIRDRCLNHLTSQGDVEGTHYNVYEYQREKLAAFGRWADEIASIVGGRR